jgi:microcystin degradation protein MlrC
MTQRPLRIAVGQISSESNHFVSRPCELELFYSSGFVYHGAELLRLRGKGGEVAGMLSVLDQAGEIEIVPLLAARGNSSGPLSAACYSLLREHLLAPLRAAGPLDGVLLSHHGSMAAIGEDDPEGDIAAAARQIVGPGVPIAMTLDLHGNITARMVENTTALLGYEQYPHYDALETGQRAARLLLRTVRDEVRPAMAYARLPMILTGFHGSTFGDGPFARLMRKAKALEQASAILSISLSYVGSYIDMPDMGSGAVVITDDDESTAVSEARRLAEVFWASRREFDVEALTVAEAVRRGRAITGGPVLLLDTADTMGGGAEGDSADLVRDLLALGITEPGLAMVVDPEAAQQCRRRGVGSEITLRLGHKQDEKWGEPAKVSGRVLGLLDGDFEYTGGILGGSRATMGPSAVLGAGSVQVLIMSYPTYDWADEQYRAAGLDPTRAKFVGVKNMMNYRRAYSEVMKGAFVLDLPGPTPASMRNLPFRRANRPIFPLDDITEPLIALTTSRPLV